MSTAAFTAVLIFLTRQLGPAGYGTFALAISITGVVLRPAAGGTSQAAARFIAERHGDLDCDHRRSRHGVEDEAADGGGDRGRRCSRSRGPIADLYNTPELAWPLRGAAIAFFGQSMMHFSRSAFTALRRTSRTFGLVISESAVEFTASVALVLPGRWGDERRLRQGGGVRLRRPLRHRPARQALGRSPLFNTGR